MPYDPISQPNNHYLQPEWPAPPTVNAYCTTRRATSSTSKGYANFNLATHVGDDTTQVETNRQLLQTELQLPTSPHWLNQIHSNTVIEITAQTPPRVDADASYTSEKNKVCIILTADCLPILLCNKQGSEVAALHCGWRGLYAGIIQNTIQQLKSNPQELIAWFGPAISVSHYQVGSELRDKFIRQASVYAEAFIQHHDRWHLDLTKLAHLILSQAGVTTICGGNYCTYSNPDQFYSHRFEGPNTGRTASLIWLT